MAAAVCAISSVSSSVASCSASCSASDLGASRRDALFGTALKGSVGAVPGTRNNQMRGGAARAYTGVAQPSTTQASGNLTLYDLLGIPNHVSLKEIKSAYREKARQYHPDVNPASEEQECVRKFVEIQKAYGVLVNPDLRARYDSSLRYAPQFRGLRYGVTNSGADNFGSDSRWGGQIVATPSGLSFRNSAMKMANYAPGSGEFQFRCSYEMC